MTTPYYQPYWSNSASDELEHHGILGMKWGVRNGPPYPLSGGNYTRAEKKVIKRRFNRNSIYDKNILIRPYLLTKQRYLHYHMTRIELKTLICSMLLMTG